MTPQQRARAEESRAAALRRRAEVAERQAAAASAGEARAAAPASGGAAAGTSARASSSAEGQQAAPRARTPGVKAQPVFWNLQGPRSGGIATCKGCRSHIASHEPRLQMYQAVMGTGYAAPCWHVECLDARMLGQVRRDHEATFQQVMAERERLEERRRQEQASQQQQSTSRKHAQRGMRDFFGPKPARGGS